MAAQFFAALDESAHSGSVTNDESPPVSPSQENFGTAYLFIEDAEFDQSPSHHRESFRSDSVFNSVATDAREEHLMRKIFQDEVRKMINLY